MTQDPVCGMKVDESKAKEQSRQDGRTFSFCSRECKERFDRDPGRYLTQGGRPSVEEQAQPRH